MSAHRLVGIYVQVDLLFDVSCLFRANFSGKQHSFSLVITSCPILMQRTLQCAGNSVSAARRVYRVVQKRIPSFILGITSVILHRFNHSFTVSSRNLWRVNMKFFHPPHLYVSLYCIVLRPCVGKNINHSKIRQRTPWPPSKLPSAKHWLMATTYSQ